MNEQGLDDYSLGIVHLQASKRSEAYGGIDTTSEKYAKVFEA